MNNKANTNKVKIGLIQINNAFSGQYYLPYSVGILKAYVQKYAKSPDRFEFLPFIHSRIPVVQATETLRGADIVGFSSYVWNINISLEIAKSLRQLNPGVIIVFGGPQVPDSAENFLREHSFIDLVCHGEGESVFLSILESLGDSDWLTVSGISFLRKDGTFVNHHQAPRIGAMEMIPSPYLDGVFNSLMQANDKTKWLALWETNRGCPFSCAYCDWGSATKAKVLKFDIERLFKEIDWFSNQKIEFIFCCDANFGILPRDYDLATYAAKVKQETGYPRALSVQNTKNATERAYQVQKVLSEAGLNKGVTISLQSVDPITLKSIGRENISSASFQILQSRFTRDRVETYTDMILGLPGETYDTFLDGISHVIENGQHNRIQFNNLTIMPNAEMGNPEYQKKYGMVMVHSKIINIHGSTADSDNDIMEHQELVIATNSMPKNDWVRTRALCWMVALLHFDKIFQIPLVLLHETCSISYRELIEVFMVSSDDKMPILSEVSSFFMKKAQDIQNGNSEYCHSEKWLNIWWPADEYILIQLCIEGKLNEFYREAELLLFHLLEAKDVTPPLWLHEAIELNRNHIILPFQTTNLELTASHNIWEFYKSVLVGETIPLVNQKRVYRINRTRISLKSWEDWCREVIWYGNKKGAYLYGNDLNDETQLEGHF